MPECRVSGDSADIMTLRPATPSENSSRGNTAYGESSSFCDPGVSVRGDCARMVLYTYVRWGNSGKMWGADGVMENLDVLMKWMAEDPVDTWEMGRNDSVQSITGTRNVFVDYPELAWQLFGRSMPSNISTPSRKESSESTTPTQEPTQMPTQTPTQAPTMEANNTFTKVTNVAEITAGGEFVLVVTNGSQKLALAAPASKITPVDVTDRISGTTLTAADTTPVYTIAAVSGGVSLKMGSNYLGYNSSTSFSSSTSAYAWTVSEKDNTDTFQFTSAAKTDRAVAYQISGGRYGAYSTNNTSGYTFYLEVYKKNTGSAEPTTALSRL